MKKLEKLLYIHYSPFFPKSQGKLNITMLQVFSMCNAFSKIGLEVTLYMEGDKEFESRIRDLQENAFHENLNFKIKKWKKIVNNRLINRILIRNRVKNIAKMESPDAVFTRESAFLKPLLNAKTKIIYESHNIKQHNTYTLISNYFIRQIIKASKHPEFISFFTISNALSERWNNMGVDSSKIFSWHDGFDKILFSSPKEKNHARILLNLPENKIIATYTGGLYYDRELEHVIDLAVYFPDVLFLIIGGPEENKNYYQNLAATKSVDNIMFKGLINHNSIPDFLYASDILLALWSSKAPAINYCSPLKLFEYMAAERLILANAFPTIKEVLEDNYDAILCKPDNFESLKSKFEFSLENYHNQEFGINARTKAFQKYTWDIRARKFLDFISNNYSLN